MPRAADMAKAGLQPASARAKSRISSHRRQHGLLPCAALCLAACCLVGTVSFAAVPGGPCRAAEQPGLRPAARRQRREILVATGLLPPAILGTQATLAEEEESAVNKLIKEARRKQKEDAAKPGIFNPNSYKIKTQNYNATVLQSFLPTVYVNRRLFEARAAKLNDPKTNASDPRTFDILRDQSRKAPANKLRKEAFRVKLWLREKSDSLTAGETAYERIKRALDDEDTQFLLASRSDGLVEPAAIRIAKKNAEAILDAIDQLLDLIPVEEREAAKAVAETKPIPPVELILIDKYKRTALKKDDRGEASANKSTSTDPDTSTS